MQSSDGREGGVTSPQGGAGDGEPAPEQTEAKAAAAWSISFGPQVRRKIGKKERAAILKAQERCGELPCKGRSTDGPQVGAVVDSEGNRLEMVNVDALVDTSALIPRDLRETTREHLLKRLCFHVPRLLCVVKQYPRSCGVTSLTSVWNYLYSCIGSGSLPPVSQEEVMVILGFAPPFDKIAWGGFTGNATLLRWFHTLNRHFGVRGRAYILYKAQGKGRTRSTAANPSDEARRNLKDALSNPNAAVIYHCYNHYMVPIGWQEIPCAQTDFFQPLVPDENSETTFFIGEVSRGRHDALYAKKWSEIAKDIECVPPQFYNIRRPELGIQSRGPDSKKLNACRPPPPAAETGDEPPAAAAPVVCSSGADATAVSPAPGSAGPPVVASSPTKKKPGNNLHCLMCFRSDIVEDRMDRFERVSSPLSSADEDDMPDEDEDDDAEEVAPLS